MSRKLARGAEFHENLAENWEDKYAKTTFEARRQLVAWLLAERVEAGANWLDVGCGTGTLTREIVKFGAYALGVDGSPRMIDAANSHNTAARKLCRFSVIDNAEALPQSNGMFDGVLCSSMIEYVDDADKVLAEISRVVKPGGYMVLSVPHRWSPVRLAQIAVRSIAGLFGRQLFPYLRHSKTTFFSYEIAADVESHGFVIEARRSFDPFLGSSLLKIFPPSLMFIIARKE